MVKKKPALGSLNRRCAVKILAPYDIIGVFQFYQSWVICITRHEFVSLFIHKPDFILFKIPVDAVFASSQINKGNPVCLFPAEDPDICSLIRYDCTVKNPCNSLNGIPSDNRIFPVPPQRQVCPVLCRTLLPWHFRYIVSNNSYFAHFFHLFLYFIFHNFIPAPDCPEMP